MSDILEGEDPVDSLVDTVQGTVDGVETSVGLQDESILGQIFIYKQQCRLLRQTIDFFRNAS